LLGESVIENLTPPPTLPTPTEGRRRRDLPDRRQEAISIRCDESKHSEPMNEAEMKGRECNPSVNRTCSVGRTGRQAGRQANQQMAFPVAFHQIDRAAKERPRHDQEECILSLSFPLTPCHRSFSPLSHAGLTSPRIRAQKKIGLLKDYGSQRLLTPYIPILIKQRPLNRKEKKA
jgi:hypothetical protein